MTNREFYLQCRKAELPAFVNVLKALPPDRMDYKPHDRSPSAEQIVWTLAGELRSCIEVVKEHRAEWKSEPAPPLNRMIELFEQWSAELTEVVSKMDEQAWDQLAKFYFQGKMVSEQPVSQFLWMILFDAIHHRGQLTTYLRPMGGKVPAIYGPSGDSRTG